MPLILGTNSIKDTGYDVANSLRFDSASSQDLSRTKTTSSTLTKFTFSWWFKRSSFGVDHVPYGVWVDGNNRSYLDINDEDRLVLFEKVSGTTTISLATSMLFRDPLAWYHVLVVADTTQSNSSDRIKFYVNGELITDFSSSTYPSQNANLFLQNNTSTVYVGSVGLSYWNGYMAEIVHLDGIAGSIGDFGEFDEDSNIWKPIDVSGLTFGTNGFYLDFENSGSLGADVSGNGNNFTVNNLTAIDQSTDTCTNNFATLNPLTKSSATFSEGNLKQGGAGASAVATFGVSSGKWYFEQKILGGNNEAHLGFALENSSIFKDNVTGSTVRGSGYVSLYSFDGKIYNEGSATSSFGTFSANDIISFALDVDAGDIFLYQNGTLLNSGSAVVSGKTGKTWFPFGNFDAGNVTGIEHNFGGTQTFTISSGNSDGNGYGNFEYQPPSGYLALNTKNLATDG